MKKKRNLINPIVILLFIFAVSCTKRSSKSTHFEAVIPDPKLPAPQNVIASDGSSVHQIRITWNKVENADSYNVYRSTTFEGTYFKIAKKIVNTSYNNIGMQEDVYFYYKVSANDSKGNEGLLSEVDSGYADFPAPGAPGDINASNGSSSVEVSISWDAVPKTSLYEIFRSNSLIGGFVKIGENNVNSYIDREIEAGDKLYYKVRAIRKSSLEGTEKLKEGNFSGIDIGYAKYTAPDGLSCTKGKSSSYIRLSWNALPYSNLDVYVIYRSSSFAGSYSEIATSGTNSYDDASTGLLPGKKYYYLVSGKSKDSLEGSQSNFNYGYKSLNYPTNIQATDGKYHSKIIITWNAAAGAVRYTLLKAVNSENYDIEIDAGQSTKYEDKDVQFGNTYRYKVIAFSSDSIQSQTSPPDTGFVKEKTSDYSVTVSWDPNKEKSVNQPGGGYRVYYSQTQNFNISGAEYQDVPYVSGHASPNETTLYLDSGTWYIKIAAYSSLGNGFMSVPSDEQSITME